MSSDKPPLTLKERANAIPLWVVSAVAAIEADILGRRRLLRFWESMDEETKSELRLEWASIIQEQHDEQ